MWEVWSTYHKASFPARPRKTFANYLSRMLSARRWRCCASNVSRKLEVWEVWLCHHRTSISTTTWARKRTHLPRLLQKQSSIMKKRCLAGTPFANFLCISLVSHLPYGRRDNATQYISFGTSPVTCTQSSSLCIYLLYCPANAFLLGGCTLLPDSGEPQERKRLKNFLQFSK